MDYLEIEGGRTLHGEVVIQGSKNAALPILSAALLHKGTTVLRNCPHISDVSSMLEILRGFGCEVRWEGDALVLRSENLCAARAPKDYAGVMRSSIMLLGSLLGRLGEAFLPYPGGCVIGERPIDLHLWALRQMGAELSEEPEGLRAVCKKPKGARIRLPFPSVGATENVVLLAVRAEGVTVLENAAREPEIAELCRYLNGMGARITGAGTKTITVTGVSMLKDTEFTVMSDRIVAGTYSLLAAACGGSIRLVDAPLSQLGALRQLLKRMGIEQQERDGSFFLNCRAPIEGGLCVSTAPYPGFPTDLQSPLMAALCTVRGESVIDEQIFEARFKIVEELRRMGAEIRVEGSRAFITGKGKGSLRGEELEARELRGGAALCIAAAAARGKTRICQYHYIARGYENIIRDLQGLGVVIH